MAALRRMARAQRECPRVRAGLFRSIAPYSAGSMKLFIYEKALCYRSLGVVGIDLAPPQNPSFRIEE
ncbi:MAG: hypothetical protein KatS3mg100_552 [Candidatus Parcubacteria bacterium]|jgi:hypothetical protein|nr:MAG: hypothetical protein KatS3mg100_552 [Candidatus Parcubacteria bacterium]